MRGPYRAIWRGSTTSNRGSNLLAANTAAKLSPEASRGPMLWCMSVGGLRIAKWVWVVGLGLVATPAFAQAPAPWTPPPQAPPYGAQTPTPPAENSDRPEFSVRLDPFNWVINGRLGLELEVEALDFMTVEAVPQFVTTEAPPAFNFQGQPDILFQKSNGWGPLAGSSIGAGFWLDGKPFKGSVLRLYLTNYSIKYVTRDKVGVIDSAVHTERRLMGFLGSHRRFGAFTIAGGIGLGVELNKERRCFANASVASVTTDCPSSDQLIALDRDAANAKPQPLNGQFDPAYIDIRFSLGFVF